MKLKDLILNEYFDYQTNNMLKGMGFSKEIIAEFDKRVPDSEDQKKDLVKAAKERNHREAKRILSTPSSFYGYKPENFKLED